MIVGGRKFFGTILVILLSSLFLATNHLSGGEWVTITTMALGIFGGSNVWQKK